MTAIRITRAGPLTTLQDAGRFGYLRHGISASGPMDRAAYNRAGTWLGAEGSTAIEFTAAGLGFVVEGGSLAAAGDGGSFALRHNDKAKDWPARLTLQHGDVVEIAPGPAGNYGYLRFDHEIEVPLLLGSRSTNLVAGLGGFDGRALRTGDRLDLGARVKR
ncbi:MAG: 5-oxoprolinase subunit C family protein, partial [Devosia sp.]